MVRSGYLVLPLALVALMALPVQAEVLAPGGIVTLEGEAGFGPGPVIYDVAQDFEVRSSFGTLLYQGQLQNRVVRLDDTETLAFIYRIRNTTGGLNGIVGELGTEDFTDWATEVEWRPDGLGDIGPDLASRSSDGSVVTFVFSDGLPSGLESYFIVIKTDAEEFADGGSTTIRLTNGLSVVLPTVQPVTDDTPPIAEITDPSAFECTCNPEDIIGTASDPDSGIVGYRLEWAASPGGPWNLIANGTSGVVDDVLGTWNTTGLQGYHFLRLTVENGVGLESSFTSVVWVDGGFDNLEVREPENGDIRGRVICIDGTAFDNHCFDYYAVSYRPAGMGAYQPVDPDNPTYTSTVITDLMATWNTGVLGIADGEYELLVRAYTDCGESASELITLTVDNTPPVAVITSPTNCEQLDGEIVIRGTASDEHLSGWSVSYTGGDANGWVTIATGDSSIEDGVLAVWDTGNLPACAYTIRLRVTDQSILNCNSATRHQTNFYVSLIVGEVCPLVGDINGDGVVNNFDIDPFVELLTGL